MCGICGWVDWEEDLTCQKQIVEAMSRTLSPRGPDAAGTWLSPRAAIAHRRLVVVDPVGGGQPMIRSRGDRKYVITYNGELYNTPDLQRELKARGYSFQGYSDTEALLFAFMEWGPDCLERLNGIFAFAVWDEEEESLFLARDRLGVKPLFYTRRGSAFLFASELKALLAHPLVEPAVDAEGLAEVFLMGPGRTPGHGVFRGIEELKPGHWLRYDRQGTTVRRYWALESRPHTDDFKTTTAKVRWLLEDTVARQLVADVPVCTLLSGGIDSSAVTAFAAAFFRRKGRGPVRTYSVDYVGNEDHFQPTEFEPSADGPWAQRMAAYLGTEHRVVRIGVTELADALTPAVHARDLPGMADVDSSLYLFSRAIRTRDTVALSGEAADEIFGGYPWFRREEDIWASTFPWMRNLELRVGLLSPEVARYIRPQEYISARYQEALAEVPRLPGEDPNAARRREISYLSITRFMPVLLDRKDRMSMAFGLEVRVPYCDHRLVEYVWNIPWEMKFCNQTEKAVLRHALRGVLPDEVLWRRKSPYPKTHNPAYTAIVRKRLRRILDDPGSPLRPLLNLSAVRALATTGGMASGIPWFGQLMTGPQLMAYLIQVDVWLRAYRVVIQ
ncbi:asparagine synthase (glutamine-hydrolysing) [Thermodesulfitimonas autotrophica]|uniref:asparagine synthase (glutamine-hydrolyzing) n=1 Tax=Thermodesulfitimonas autotrophica TaxID=1894989 RepID=A0A3N5AXM0_9THEO|nr:asparagine synthase (glutamine-hydrolyzing) [Thermodesulfitimonas autotrophica]RPF49769.1 asparagine synthase (glutamine-hydrolysing) [Thermodesulfitimonas autotrophica]